MTRIVRPVRNVLVVLATTLGFAVVTTAPAWALPNHSEPFTHAAPTR